MNLHGLMKLLKPWNLFWLQIFNSVSPMHVTALYERELQDGTLGDYYYETTNLGSPNVGITVGNPMKGLTANPSGRKNWPAALPASLHLHKIAFNLVMRNDPDVVGVKNAFNWTSVDAILKTAESYRSHAIIRFYIHWPKKPLALPDYLTKAPHKVTLVQNRGEDVPWYGDVELRNAMKQFIFEFGKKYDGDTRLFSIQAGLIGAFGEWHSQGCTFNEEPCDPEYVEKEVVAWYGQAFSTTHIQFRRPERVDVYDLGFGFHDDSFTYITVGGEPNGGLNKNSIFWTAATKFGTTHFWKRAPMGGEIRPGNGDAFSLDYPAGTEYHQDFNVCVKTTHATYIAWGEGFNEGRGENGPEQKNALYAWARMGYNFEIDKVAVAPSSSTGKVNIDVTVMQTGVAPFYYPLNLNLFCEGSLKSSAPIKGNLTEKGNKVIVSLKNVSRTSSCLSSVELQLGSSYLYDDRPIRWAQGSDGKVVLKIPLS